jgi:hypothetical protein
MARKFVDPMGSLPFAAFSQAFAKYDQEAQDKDQKQRAAAYVTLITAFLAALRKWKERRQAQLKTPKASGELETFSDEEFDAYVDGFIEDLENTITSTNPPESVGSLTVHQVEQLVHPEATELLEQIVELQKRTVALLEMQQGAPPPPPPPAPSAPPAGPFPPTRVPEAAAVPATAAVIAQLKQSIQDGPKSLNIGPNQVASKISEDADYIAKRKLCHDAFDNRKQGRECDVVNHCFDTGGATVRLPKTIRDFLERHVPQCYPAAPSLA